MRFSCYNVRAVRDTEHAAIAQQVERILGKDEVSSSNLDSSSNKNLSIFGSKGFLFFTKLPNIRITCCITCSLYETAFLHEPSAHPSPPPFGRYLSGRERQGPVWKLQAVRQTGNFE